jgi:hypothetical protein
MEIQFGKGKTKYGPGVQIDLTGEEVAMAIYTYLTAHNVHIDGTATISVNGKLCQFGGIYVDPSARVIANGKEWNGKGEDVVKNTGYFEALEKWENSLCCRHCGNDDKETFGYTRTVANGDVYFCEECQSETLVDEKPNEDDY